MSAPRQSMRNFNSRDREKNWAAAVIQNANAARWLVNNVEGGSARTERPQSAGTPRPSYASRTYKILGKVDLSDSVWLEVTDNISLYRFSKVTVKNK